MADWSARLTPLLAVGSGLGYLLGAATVAEFAAQLGLQASDLGLGAKEYVIVALLAAVAVICLLPTAILAPAFLFEAGREIVQHIRRERSRGITGPREIAKLAQDVVPTAVGAIWATTFLTLLLLLVPAYLVENDPNPWQSLGFGAIAGVAVAIVVIPAAIDRKKATLQTYAEGGLTEDARLASRHPALWTVRWTSTKRALTATSALLVFLTVFSYAVLTSAQFGRLIVSADVPAAPRTPFLLRWVVHPTPACAVTSAVEPLAGKRVLHIARGGDHEVLALEGKVWLVAATDVRLTFHGDCVAATPRATR